MPTNFNFFQDCSTKVCADLRKKLGELEEECIKYENAYNDQLKKRKCYDSESVKRELQDLTVIDIFIIFNIYILFIDPRERTVGRINSIRR